MSHHLAYEPSADAVLEIAKQHPNGITARALSEALVNSGYTKSDSQKRMQSLIDTGELALGRNLELIVPEVPIAPDMI